MRRTDPKVVLFSHFGPSPDGAADLTRYRTIVEQWRDVALSAAREKADPEHVAGRLKAYDMNAPAGAAPTEGESIISSYALAAQGFLRYFETRGLLGRDPK